MVRYASRKRPTKVVYYGGDNIGEVIGHYFEPRGAKFVFVDVDTLTLSNTHDSVNLPDVSVGDWIVREFGEDPVAISEQQFFDRFVLEADTEPNQAK